jgi:hypothetical protein
MLGPNSHWTITRTVPRGTKITSLGNYTILTAKLTYYDIVCWRNNVSNSAAIEASHYDLRIRVLHRSIHNTMSYKAIILGMDWLVSHGAQIDCGDNTVTL